MLSSLFRRLLSPRPRQNKAVRRPAFSSRLSVERLEEREVLSSPASLAAPVLGAALVGQASPHQVSQILPLSISNISVLPGANGQPPQLQANGLLGSIPFTAPLTLSATPAATTGGPPILDLDLGPIDLNLLGLEVKTSPICLDITAIPGTTLGDLFAGIANALNGGTSLGGILGGLSSTDLSTVTSTLTDRLNAALGAATAPAAVTGASTNVLHLSVGPLDLNVLGLDVTLNNCNNGPVTVDVIAHSGPGQLLGNLIGGLSHLLDSSASSVALGNKISKIAGEIASLL